MPFFTSEVHPHPSIQKGEYTLLIINKGHQQVLDATNWCKLVSEGAHLQQVVFEACWEKRRRLIRPNYNEFFPAYYSACRTLNRCFPSRLIPPAQHNSNVKKGYLEWFHRWCSEDRYLDSLLEVPFESPHPSPLCLSIRPSDGTVEGFRNQYYDLDVSYSIALGQEAALSLSPWDMPRCFDMTMKCVPEYRPGTAPAYKGGWWSVRYDEHFRLSIRLYHRSEIIVSNGIARLA